MYESPITIVTQQSHNTISKQFDDYILTTVEAELGCEVDKEELIKALTYDRNQYDKGFRDGYYGMEYMFIIYLVMKGYTINFRKFENDKDDYRLVVIELQKEFLGIRYFKKFIIDPKICDMVNLSCEHILKNNILRAVSEFDKYNENKKKMTT